MKLRLRDNSIRLRLSRGEVSQLATTGEIAATTQFAGSSPLQYRCVASRDAHLPGAAFERRCLTVSLPLSVVEHWASGDDVSIQGEETVPGGVLTILVEKDFACLAPREGEDDTDMFANPLEGRGH